MNALLVLLLGLGFCTATLCQAEVKLLLPLARTAYQCNENIPLTVLRSGTPAKGSGDLGLKLTGTDGSCLTFSFPIGKAESRSVAHLQVNGWLLRPGSYRVEVSCDGVTALTNITLHIHIRRSDFKLINWEQGKGKGRLPQSLAKDSAANGILNV